MLAWMRVSLAKIEARRITGVSLRIHNTHAHVGKIHPCCYLHEKLKLVEQKS